ncbi:MAG: nitroreductase family protein [Acidimicrobiia bacterium]|nr:nitroreductase family protein [Acidimicrobiia bacterium]
MTSLFDAIAQRRMVRSYRAEPVAEATIDRIVAAAHSAPSAGNTRSLELLVLTGEDVVRYWETTLAPDKRDAFPWPGLLRAPLLLVPYVDPARYAARYSEPDKARTGLGVGPHAWPVPYWWVDGGAAVENILLAAVACGLGACLFGQFDHEPSVRSAFGVPDHFRAVGTVAVGHPDTENDRPSRSSQRARRAPEKTTHRGRW